MYLERLTSEQTFVDPYIKRQAELAEQRAKWLAEMRAYEAKVQEIEDLEAVAAVAAKEAMEKQRREQQEGKDSGKSALTDDDYYDELLKDLFPLG